MAFLGFITLVRIVVNNAIILVDRIQIEMEEHGRTPQDAFVETARHHFRQILITTFSSI